MAVLFDVFDSQLNERQILLATFHFILYCVFSDCFMGKEYGSGKE